jgi:FAD/FMN-containing dehydrogenase
MHSPAEIPSVVIAKLAEILGSSGLRTGGAAATLHPGFHADNLKSGVVALPASTAEVADVLALCNAHRISVVPQGGRTGLAGGAASAPGQLVMAMQRMNRIIAIDPHSAIAEVEAGVVLQDLADAAATHGLSPGIDLSARGSCTIGGMIATNAGGMEAFRYGVMRNRVLGIEAVLADGSVLGDLTRVTKSNAGYDLKHLLIGSEGTLGIVTRAIIALVPAERSIASAFCACPGTTEAVALYRRLQRMTGAALARAELLWRSHVAVSIEAMHLTALADFAVTPVYVLVEVDADAQESARAALEDTLAAAADAGEIADALFPKSEQERALLWRMREEWVVDRIRPGGLWFDISVPLAALAGYADALAERIAHHDAELGLYMIGHLGDGNLHITVNGPTPIPERYEEISALVYAPLAALGGSFSAEHGIGLEKRKALIAFGDPVKLQLMRRIKAAFDPAGIMNPGKVLAPLT